MRSYKILFSSLIVIVLLLGFASAGFFSDLWNKITGSSVEGVSCISQGDPVCNNVICTGGSVATCNVAISRCECPLTTGTTTLSGSFDNSCNNESLAGNEFCEILLRDKCLAGDTIAIGVSACSNAHAQVWNASAYSIAEYPYVLCCKGSLDRTCVTQENKSNEMLSLSSLSNAHVQSPTNSSNSSLIYPNKVCLGNFAYTVKTVCDTSMGEKEILGISGATNAHVGNLSKQSMKLCTIELLSITSSTWRNMRDQIIESEPQKNDLIKLYVEGNGFEGKGIQYTIYRNNQAILSTIQGAQSDSEAFVTWRAGERADGSGFDVGRNNVYKFNAKLVNSSGNGLNSSELTVASIESNTAPFANILLPINGMMFEPLQLINFSADGSYDEDDEISTDWNLGDGKTKNIWNFSDSYSLPGQKNILLTVTDDREPEFGPLSDKDTSGILIAQEGKNIFSNIESPEDNEVFLGGDVRFSAEGTYAVECYASSASCTDSDCALVYSTLYCGGKERLESDIGLNWTMFRILNEQYQFDRQLTGSWGSEVTGQNNINGITNEFTRENMPTGKYRINLISSINPTSSDSADILVNAEEIVLCSENGREWIDNEGSSDSFNNCKLPGIAETCCPDNYECIIGNDGKGVCSPSNDFSCFNYEIENECENYNINVAKRSIKDMSGLDCGGFDSTGKYVAKCRCQWDSADNECDANYTLINIDVEESPTLGNCVFNNQESATQCVDEKITLKWSATWTGDAASKPAECTSGSFSIPCPPVIAVPFFTPINVIAVIVILVIVYYLIINSKKKGKKKSKR